MAKSAEVVRTGAEAMSKGDMDTLAAQFADGVVFHVPGKNQLAGDYNNKQEVLGKLLPKIMEITGGTFHLAEVHDVAESDEHAVGMYRITAQRDGKSYEWRAANVYHVRDDKIVEVFINPVDHHIFDEVFR